MAPKLDNLDSGEGGMTKEDDEDRRRGIRGECVDEDECSFPSFINRRAYPSSGEREIIPNKYTKFPIVDYLFCYRTLHTNFSPTLFLAFAPVFSSCPAP